MSRAASPADLPALAALDADCFGRPWPPDAYRQELVRPFARLRVVEARGHLVGLCCTWITGEQAHLLRIATHARVRRQGLGRTLLAEVLAQATAAGCHEILLEVAAGNVPAVTLYGALGFRPIARRARYYTQPPDDALVMRRSLVEPAERAGGRGGTS